MLPLAGSIVDDGRDETDEEQKLRNESRKILGIPGAAGLRHVRTRPGLHRALAADQRPLRPADQPGARPGAARRGARRRAVGRADPAQAAGRDPSYVGRIRADETVENGLAFFVSNDNLRKGAALNAVQVAELVAAELS